MKIDLYDAGGAKKGSVDLNKTIFEAKVNTDLMHRAVIMRQANGRMPIAHTKTRANVSATTAKAFRQKGTGRARRGALSTNLLRGGGVTHGPLQIRNYTKSMPKKERRAALFSSLSAKAQEKGLFAWEGPQLDTPKTKTVAEVLKKLPTAKKYLFVVASKDNEALLFQKSIANIPQAKTILANYLNPYDVLHAEQICFVGDALHKVEENFLTDKK